MSPEPWTAIYGGKWRTRTRPQNGGIDPINIFPIPPDNDNASESNNYSPMWDAHVNMWTEAAIKDKKVRRITSFEDLKGLIDAGPVTSAMINPPGARRG